MTGGDIRAWRRRHGVSQRELAEFLGVTRVTVTLWESGAHAPPKAVLLLLPLLPHGAKMGTTENIALQATNERTQCDSALRTEIP